MPEHRERRRAPHRPEDVFAVVADVRDYPSFIPWIRSMRVIREEVTGGVGDMTAEAVVGYKLLRERFTTWVQLDKPKLAIDVAFVSGPLDQLENRWRFHPLPDGSTEIDFFLRFELKNPILRAIMAASFDRAAGKIMDGFERRARERFPLIASRPEP